MREMQTGKELSVNEHSCLMAYKACFYRLSRMTTSSGLIPAMKKGPAGPLSLMLCVGCQLPNRLLLIRKSPPESSIVSGRVRTQASKMVLMV